MSKIKKETEKSSCILGNGCRVGCHLSSLCRDSGSLNYYFFIAFWQYISTLCEILGTKISNYPNPENTLISLHNLQTVNIRPMCKRTLDKKSARANARFIKFETISIYIDILLSVPRIVLIQFKLNEQLKWSNRWTNSSTKALSPCTRISSCTGTKLYFHISSMDHQNQIRIL